MSSEHDRVLAELRSRRDAIRVEMRYRLDEIENTIRLISSLKVATAARNGRSSADLQKAVLDATGSIFEEAVQQQFLEKGSVSTKDLAALVPGSTKAGPVVAAWKRRARASGHAFDELVSRTLGAAGDMVFTLTEAGRRVLEARVQGE